VNRRERSKTAQYLDELAPLQGASHSEVVDYSVTVPFFYAELRARLANGKSTRLVDSSQFLGWFGYGANPTLLFNCGNRRVVVETGSHQTPPPDSFIARNGDLIPLHA
jgi:Malate synthase G, alpha-beta insertion domain